MNIAIKRAIDLLTNEWKIDTSNFIALDLFARDASWQTKFYANKVKQIHAWEIEEKFKKDLLKILPKNAVVSIVDSHEMIHKDNNEYDMIVLDNPQGCYGSRKQYCEHFDLLSPALKKLSESAVLIFNVKTKPFNYEEKFKWKKRRSDFYNLQDTRDIPLDFMKNFYENMFKSKGFEISQSCSILRPQETGLYMFVYLLKRRP